MSVTIKGLDRNVFRNFKAEAVRHGLKLSEAASEAFSLWVASKRLGKVKDRERMTRAARDMDTLSKKSARGWSGTEEIRKWRDQRK
jgi:hypothetical protein